MSNAAKALIDECQRQSENCAYTSTTFLIWLRFLKGARLVAHCLPIACGALATWKILMQGSPIWAAIFALSATLIPPLYKASKTDAAIEDYLIAAGEFTNLRDRFRQAALVDSHKPIADFEAAVKPMLLRLEKVRSRPLTPPEFCFWMARKKHKAGHYDHDYDQARAAAGQTDRNG